jgi:hypothetical protein
MWFSFSQRERESLFFRQFFWFFSRNFRARKLDLSSNFS